MTATLADAVAMVESSGNPHAIRFEPSLYAAQIASPTPTEYQPAIDRIQAIHQCSHETAVMMAMTSWGRYQLMGFNLYSPDGFAYGRDVAVFLESDRDQLDAFGWFIGANHIDWAAEQMLVDPTLIVRFAIAYNGPGDPSEYCARLKAALTA
jgi:N-acetylmuramidase